MHAFPRVAPAGRRSGALADFLSTFELVRIPGVDRDPFNGPIVFCDRVLLPTQQGNCYLRPTVIWRWVGVRASIAPEQCLVQLPQLPL
jgi:hypothetical protein